MQIGVLQIIEPEISNRDAWSKWLKPPLFMALIDTELQKRHSCYQK